MAAPVTAAGFLGALRAEGLVVVEVGAWQTHNREGHGPWGPVHGVMIHHTVTQGTQYAVDLCRDGHSELPGPLCHGVIAKNGVVYLVGYGRANHAGLGDPDVLSAVIAERALPVDDEATVDGNRAFYGFECENLGDGVDPWPAVQLEAIERASAALCRVHGWGAGSVLGHLEWQPGKPDPRGFTMASMRARVAGRLQLPVLPPPPRPTRPVVDLSELIRAAKTDPGREGTPVSYAGVRVLEVALVDEGLLQKRFLDGHYGWSTRSAYSAWQESLGYWGRRPGEPADGVPGAFTLGVLARKHGFDVVG
ncbi:N-acetylmuramoyl-L-alanine amidase [Streptomyces sp. H27-H5]|uniref:N-acetylmuramoyl-L-alanine amidase n=1 Tax=Streptomyces sp. H27-H5 TaxID=2996460 RepID=UPI0022708627|nr:N-acetylmuramoyl-L-alanine amidase [Streptomyces sp. H27-H5]MCY0957758.1 N-acetylmuramoyl-L-alanine amidase [Streptomyces sp. H27-H5]